MTEELGNITSGISSVVGGIEALGIEIPQGMKNVIQGIQGVMSILSGIATIATAIQTMQTAQMFKFWSGGGVVHAAEGLMVPGNNFSGDLIPSMINSGELILNRAQQGNLAAQLQENNGSGYTPSHISGEQIWITLNRYTQRTGKGELVTWK